MRISSNFDAGNINVIEAQNPENIRLTLNRDHNSEFAQWFYFRLESTPMLQHTIRLEHLEHSAYPDGWKNYQAVASYDRQDWFRVDSSFDGSCLTVEHTPEHDVTYYAYFAPYSYEQHLDLLAWAQCHDDCRLLHLGETIDGRDMNMLCIGRPDDDRLKIWITARQHPGETMAEWLVDGLIHRLFDPDDGVARNLMQKAVFYVVPNMNPDGSARGHLRTNAVGANLNREWANPTVARSPEVFYVLNQMEDIGVDLFLDVHGDEAIPYNFIAGSEGNPGYNPRIADLEASFIAALKLITPEFQDVHGYPKDEPGKADLTIGSNAVGQRFDCPSMTLEMPFKDNDDLPDPAYGWSPARCQMLGEDVLAAINALLPKLKA